jgi:hypothetical protein
MRSRPILILSTLICVAFASAAPAAIAKGVVPRFDLSDPSGSPFPSDRFTVSDATQLTGLRIHLPKTDCNARPSDCNDVDVLNQLDGFNLQPRVSIPFTGPIDPASVSSDSVFLVKLGCLVASCPGASRVGINQVVWDPDTNTLYAKSDQVLDQDARYLLVVTGGVRDAAGEPIAAADFSKLLNSGQTDDQTGKAYRTELLAALDQLNKTGAPTDQVAAASAFTTESPTAVLEKIRDQLNAATPAPADFVIGTNGERTVFPLASVAGIVWKRQETTGDEMAPPTFTTTSSPPNAALSFLRVVPGAIGTIAFGKYLSPDYQNTDGVIPAFGTKTGIPQVKHTSDIYFNLFLPSGPEPRDGWPVVIAGPGSNGKNFSNVPVGVAAKLAQHGLATIAINAVGYGGGPHGTLTVTNTDGTAVTLPDGGRNIDRIGDGTFAEPSEFLDLTGRNAIILVRDDFRQTTVDLMQLARVIGVGVDVNGDGTPDLDRNRVYYFSNSLGTFYGIPFAALDPSVRASVFGGPGGSIADVVRLNAAGPYRSLLGQILAGSTPSLLNLPPGSADPINPGNPLAFNENLPPVPWDCPQPRVNCVPGAIAIQDKIERIEWAQQSGDAIAYAPHLRKAPLAGVPARPVLIPFAQGDSVVATTTAGNVLRAGDLADRTLYFRALDAFGDPNQTQVDEWLVQINPKVTQPCYALHAQESTATFLATDGTTTPDPNTITDPPCPKPGAFFETPLTGPLP